MIAEKIRRNIQLQNWKIRLIRTLTQISAITLTKHNKDGWIFLESSSTDESNSYVFAYNRKLSPEEETATLFDKVQLKSFINGEVTGEKTISVQPYAIQSEKLTADGLTDDP